MPGEGDSGASELVPVEFEGCTLYVRAASIDGTDSSLLSDERQIGVVDRTLDGVLKGVAGFAKRVVGTMQATDASRVTLEFGCEIAVESGTFVAVIGKNTAKSTLKISLEWAGPQPSAQE